MLTGDSGIAYGKQNVFYEMLRGFSEHWDRISVITASNEKGEVINLHGNVYIHPSDLSKTAHFDFFRHKSFILKKAREIHKDTPIDIISAHVIPPLNANVKAAMRLNRELGIPYVAELMHIPGYPTANNFFEKIERLSLDKFMQKNGKNIPYLRLVNNFETLNYTVDILKYPREKILYISAFYLDFDLFKPGTGKRDFRQFVFCGRLEKNKGLDLLLDACEIVVKKEADFKLKVVGDGSLKGWLEKEVVNRGLEKNVEVCGWLPTRDDVAKYYQESAGILMTSYNEGGPRVTLEAMACGALCITAKVGIMQEVVEDGENAFFIGWDKDDIAEKILWTMKNPIEAEEIAERGRMSVQKFEYSDALKFYADTYHNLIS